jgi:hypothetical protein
MNNGGEVGSQSHNQIVTKASESVQRVPPWMVDSSKVAASQMSEVSVILQTWNRKASLASTLKPSCQSPTLVAHAYNPIYSECRDQEDPGLKPAQANSSWDPISKKTHHKKRVGRVVQVGGSEFKQALRKICCINIFLDPQPALLQIRGLRDLLKECSETWLPSVHTAKPSHNFFGSMKRMSPSCSSTDRAIVCVVQAAKS